ncbi:MAG: FAD-dependent oxidoreductase, partial [Saprospiraceae bacterium]
MSDLQKPINQNEIDENFAQLKPLMDANMAYYESSRCLFCYDAPCIKACPTGIDIPLFIKQINTNNITGAARTIYANNYFGNTCGKVCPTEVLCEGACVYNEQNVKAIEIGRLQSHATTKAIIENKSLFTKKKENGHKIAIIGAGPAGISCACELRKMGYSVDIFEAKSTPGGLALHGTAPYKITNTEVTDEINFLKSQFGFNIHYNNPIDTSDKLKKIEKKYDAIFLGIGLGKTNMPKISGKNLQNCRGATEFIEDFKRDPLNTRMGKKIVIVGGGNTAMDAASEAARMGADTTLVYRRSKNEMGAYDFEYDLIKSVGAKALFNVTVKKVLGGTKVQKIVCVKTQSKNGVLVEIEGSEFSISCNFLILATGQEKQISILRLAGVEYDGKGKVQTNPITLQCSNPKYFSGGDA